jgi:polyisoprenoid-binding protein YceI
MKNINRLVVVLALISTTMFAQTNWNFDKSHSEIGFSVTHMLITETDGFFKDYEGTVVTTGDNFENAQISFEAKAASIFTDNEKRDNHLQSADFFDAEKYPTLQFVGKSFTKVDDKNYKLVGDLTIKGTTKEVELDVKFNGTINDPWGNTRAGFLVSGEIDRFTYGLTWNKALEMGGLVVSKEVTLDIKIQLIQAK